MKLVKGIAVLASLMVLAGCTTTARMGQFTAASTMNVRNLNYSIEDQTASKTTGDSCIKYILGFPIGHSDDRIQRAMDDAIKNGRTKGLDGDLLVNTRIDMSLFHIPFYAKNCVNVEGDLVSIKK